MTSFESLHPRGADGRFIHKFGLIKFLLGGKWVTGKVSDIDATPSGKVTIEVQESDIFGKATGVTHALSPKQIYSQPKPIGSLKIKDPKAVKTAGQAGSNPGGFYSLPDPANPEDNHNWYVKKAKSPAHGRNEALANALYRALGASVPDVYYDEEDGNVYSRIVPNSVEDMGDQLNNPEWLEMLQSNFTLDAWLANWDVFGLTWDNVKTSDGVPFRIDNGGALLYRAQGAAKGDVFGDEVTELVSFKTGKKAKVFGTMSMEHEFDGAARILALSPGEISDMVDAHNLPKSLANKLIARRASIANHYGLPLPESIPDAPEPDFADITTAGKKTRSWKKLPLWAADASLKSGDVVQFPDGTEEQYGEELPGIPAGLASKKIQMAGWLSTHGADAEVWINDASDMNIAMRPGDGEIIQFSAMGNYSWERGDKISSNLIGSNAEVLSVNHKTGIVVIKDQNGNVQILGVRHMPGEEVEVTPWNAGMNEKPKDDLELNLPEGAQDWEYALSPMPEEAKAVSYPEEAQPEDAPALNVPEEQMTYVDSTPESSTPAPKNIPMEPEAKKPVQAVAAANKIKSDVQASKEAQKSSKSTVLADGSEASPGDVIWSSKDAKSYTYVKKKGPYAVVTDPESDTPDKQLLKLASVLTASKESAPVDTGAAKPLPSANGVIPQLGDQAVAKDGWTGEIVMISPNGKFVFIEDSSGKRKRKSAGTVTITSSVEPDTSEPEALTPEISTDPDTGVTTVSVPSSPLSYGTSADSYSVAPTPLPDGSVGDQIPFVGVYYADGTFGIEYLDENGNGALGPIPQSALVKNNVGGVGKYDSSSWGPMSVQVLAKLAEDSGKDGTHLEVIWNGKPWVVLPQQGEHGGVVISNGHAFPPQVIEVKPSTVDGDMAMLPFKVTDGSLSGHAMNPDEIGVAQILMPTFDFKAMSEVIHKVKKGDNISTDGVNWMTVDEVFPDTESVAVKDPGGMLQLMSAKPGSGLTVAVSTPLPLPDLSKKPAPDATPSPDIPESVSKFMDQISGPEVIKIADVDGQFGVAPGDWVTGFHAGYPEDGPITGKVTDVWGSSHGGAQVYIQTGKNADELVFMHAPEGWPMAKHGNLTEGTPVKMTMGDYIHNVGVTEGDYIVGDDNVAHRVIGFNYLGELEVEGTDAYAHATHMTGSWVRITKGVPNDPDIEIYIPEPEPEPQPDFKFEELFALQEPDDSYIQHLHKKWGSPEFGVAPPPNTTVYYQQGSNEFIWLGGDGEVKSIKASATDGVVKSSPAPMPSQWDAMTSGSVVISEPDPVYLSYGQGAGSNSVGIVDSAEGSQIYPAFKAKPDHTIAVDLDTDTLWAIPPGAMDDGSKWLMLTVSGNEVPDLGPDVSSPNWGGVKVLIDQNAVTEIPSIPVVTVNQSKPPAEWAAVSHIPDHPQPGMDYAIFPDVGTGAPILLASEPGGDGKWHPVSDEGTLNDNFIDLPALNLLANNKGYPEATLWTPSASGESITVNGVNLPADAYVVQPETGSHVFFKDSPFNDWAVLHSDGSIKALSGDDWNIWGEPDGKQIWPEKGNYPSASPVYKDKVSAGSGPLPVGELGGSSVAYPDMLTEKDPILDAHLAQVVGEQGDNISWIKANHPGQGDDIYYKVVNDYVTTYKMKDGQLGYVGELSIGTDGVSSLKGLLSDSYIFTDITPGSFVDVPDGQEAPSWKDLVYKTVNPSQVGFANLLWKNPQEIIDAAEDDYIKETLTDAMGYVPTHYGDGHKTIMVEFDDPNGSGKAQGFFAVFADGKVAPIETVAGELVGNSALSGFQGAPLVDQPVEALMETLYDLEVDFELYDVSTTEPPTNWITGWKVNGKETPDNQWAVPVPPDAKVFAFSNGKDPATNVYRTKNGIWNEVTGDGSIEVLAIDDESMSILVGMSGKKLYLKEMPTDAPEADPNAVNAPTPVDTHKASKSVTFHTPTGKQFVIPAGHSLHKQNDPTEPNIVYAMESPDGKFKYLAEDLMGTIGFEDWVEWHGTPETLIQTMDLKPEPLSNSKMQGTPAAPKAHPSMMSAPVGADMAGLPKNGIPAESSNLEQVAVGEWFASSYSVDIWGDPNDPSNIKLTWYQVILTPEGEKHAKPYELNESTNEWMPSDQQWKLDAQMVFMGTNVHIPPSAVGVSTMSDPSVGVPTPEAPAAPKPSYPGEILPSAEDIASWGGDITKDGHIPTSGMHVKGKGPMTGTVLSVSKDKTKAVVVTSDGKKTTRLISALSVDHVGAKKVYGTVQYEDVAMGQYLPGVDTPDEAIKKALASPADGQMTGFLASGTQGGALTIRTAKDKKGNTVVRAYFRLSEEKQKALPNMFKEGEPVKGGWAKKTVPSSEVKPGDKLAMRLGSSSTPSKWKPDGDSTASPTHTVVSVSAPDSTGVVKVKLASIKNPSDTIESNFHSGPSKQVLVNNWDPNMVAPVSGSQDIPLSAEAKAQGWSKTKGRLVSNITTEGVWDPDSASRLNSSGYRIGYGSAGAVTYAQTAADGTVIEATVPTTGGRRSSDGFGAITIPVTEGSDPTAAMMAAMDRIGISYRPPTQRELRKEAIANLASSTTFTHGQIGTTHGADTDNLSDAKVAALFKEIGTLSGVPDIGWQDIYVGQDSSGTAQYYWSERVHSGLASKSNKKVLIKTNSKSDSGIISATVLNGQPPGPIRSVEGMSAGASAVSDDGNQAAYGGFYSALTTDMLSPGGKIPKSNPFWGGNMTVVAHPMAVIGRIGDIRAYETDKFGHPPNGNKSFNKLVKGKSQMDVSIQYGIPRENIGFIAVDSPAEISKAIAELKKKGIHTIGGRPLEQVIITRTQLASKSWEDLPVPKAGPPDNAIPILDVPENMEEVVAP